MGAPGSITSSWDTYHPHAQCGLPTVVKNITSGTTSTYECAAGDVGKLHEITSLVAVRIMGGTGASVVATAGAITPAHSSRPFRFRTGQASLGIATADGSAWTTAIPCTVCVVE